MGMGLFGPIPILFHQLIILRCIIRKNLWIESLDEIGEEAMRFKTAEFAIRGLCEVAEKNVLVLA
jgi:hypothetical protein